MRPGGNPGPVLLGLALAIGVAVLFYFAQAHHWNWGNHGGYPRYVVPVIVHGGNGDGPDPVHVPAPDPVHVPVVEVR